MESSRCKARAHRYHILIGRPLVCVRVCVAGASYFTGFPVRYTYFDFRPHRMQVDKHHLLNLLVVGDFRIGIPTSLAATLKPFHKLLPGQPVILTCPLANITNPDEGDLGIFDIRLPMLVQWRLFGQHPAQLRHRPNRRRKYV